MRRRGSDRNPSRSFSSNSLSSQPLTSHPLVFSPPPKSMFGNLCSDCLCPCLPVDSFLGQRHGLPSYGQQGNLLLPAIPQQEMAKLVQKAYGSEFRNKCMNFKLMVTYDLVNHILIFDGTFLQYSDLNHFRETSVEVVRGTG